MGTVLGKISVETPVHTVLRTEETYQVRRYEGTLVQAQVSSSQWDSSVDEKAFHNSAFMVLAEYIGLGVVGMLDSPKNRRNVAIAMTAPVIMQSISEPIGMNTTVPIAEAAHTLVQDTESSVPAKVGERSPPTFAVYGGSWWCVVTRVAMETELFITRLKDAGVALARPMVYKLYISTFGILAQYIGVFSPGMNSRPSPSAAITMATPVAPELAFEPTAEMAASVVTAQPTVRKTLTFLLPAQYTTETAPIPTDIRVKLSERLPQTVAVYRFTWSCDMPRAATEAEQFITRLTADGVNITGPWSFAGYNPPWTLPFYRTNEIHVPISDSPNL